MEEFLSKVITIDGTVGSGKSSVGFLFSKLINYQFVDSGLFYRAITYTILSKNLNIEDAEQNKILTNNLNIDFITQDEDVLILLDDKDVSINLHLDDVNENVSTVSSQMEVRDAVTKLQQKFASIKKSVIAGQDIGTYVFPQAKLKFFVDAPASERAKRRCSQLIKKGQNVTYEQTLDNINKREEADRSRKYHPLTVPQDAHIIQNANHSLQETVNEMIRIYQQNIS